MYTLEILEFPSPRDNNQQQQVNPRADYFPSIDHKVVNLSAKILCLRRDTAQLDVIFFF